MIKVYQLRKQKIGEPENAIYIIAESLSLKSIYEKLFTLRLSPDGFDYWIYPKTIKNYRNEGDSFNQYV